MRSGSYVLKEVTQSAFSSLHLLLASRGPAQAEPRPLSSPPPSSKALGFLNPGSLMQNTKWREDKWKELMCDCPQTQLHKQMPSCSVVVVVGGGLSPPQDQSWGECSPASRGRKGARHTGLGLSGGWGGQQALPPHSGTRPPAPKHINVPLMKLFWLIYQINTNGTGC